MSDVQQGILTPIDSAARYLTFTMSNDGNVAAALARCARSSTDATRWSGSRAGGAPRHPVPGLTEFPAFAVKDRTLPATPADVGLAARRRSRRARAACAGDRTCAGAGVCVAGCGRRFPLFERSRPSGYEDGTENPEGDDAVAAAIVTGRARPTGRASSRSSNGCTTSTRWSAFRRATWTTSSGAAAQRRTRRRTRVRAREAHRAGKLRPRRSCCAARRRGRTRVARPLLRRVRLLVPRVRRADAPDERCG